MNVLILGATGTIGRALVDRALFRSHQVTALVRDPRKMASAGALRVEVGNVLDQNALSRVVPGHDAVILAVGPGHNRASTLRTDAARLVVSAMTRAGTKRLIAFSGLGAGVTRKNRGFLFDQVLARTTLKGLLDDQNRMEGEIRRSKLDWMVIRPGEVVRSQNATMKWILSLDGSEIPPKVGDLDLALFTIQQLESDEFVHKPVAIGVAEP